MIFLNFKHMVSLVLIMGINWHLLPTSYAGELTLNILDQNDELVEDAVIMLYPEDGQTVSSETQYPNVMSQENMTFVPHVLPVYVNSKVSFPNNDETRHHVYSFSKAKVFELRLYSGKAERFVEFENTGVVVLGCNIHDNMLGYIYVSDTPLFLKSNQNGLVNFANLAAGNYSMSIWHPRLRGKKDDNKISFSIGSDEKLDLSQKLNLKRERRSRAKY